MSSYRIIPESELVEKQVEWQKLVSQFSPKTIFLQPQYQLAWLNSFVAKEQRFLQGVLSDAGQLVAVLPFFWETPQTLRLIGAVDLSDYLDVVLTPDQPELFEWLLTYLQSVAGWQTLKLESLPAESPLLTTYESQLTSKNWQVEMTQQDVCPVITLPSNWETYFSSLESKNQQSFTRLLKTIGRDDEISYRLHSTPKDVEAQIASFIQLHKASSLEKMRFWTPARETFFSDSATQLAEAGWIKLFFLDVDATPAASLIIFDYQDQYLLYNSGYDAYRFGHLGVGNALILHTIKTAIESGKKRYDFMRGDEGYKYQFGAISEALFDLTITRQP